ncbi:MAG: NACHT domain-containing protein [Planctomycetota bacterium]
MTTSSPLRLLGSTNNTRGDLFTRLTKDLFFALGYDDLRFDVHTSGHEIDIQGTHRLEPRRMVAECKAHGDKMGGADLNKLLGIVTRERDRHEPTPVTAYFVSLNGFRETGIEQELQTSEQKRIILLDGQDVIDELIRIRILVSPSEASEQAGRCAEFAGLRDADVDRAELLGHPLGYLWAVYYSRGKQRTHFVLIHADGTPLAEAVARKVIQADRECDGTLHTLTYLPPPAPDPDRAAIAKMAVERYRKWVVKECGDIQLDGLPADADLSAFRMTLERLFVPLKVVASVMEQTEDGKELTSEIVFLVGEFLDQHSRFSLLAKPGGGKSTLLKRLAVAYADPERRQEAKDQLPDRDWLPLLLRCRELRDRAHRPILELLADLAQHAGMNGDESLLFRDQIDDALRSGRALLLVDGLDEISDEGTRTTFAGHLRTFLAMFPQVAMVVTSREAGYRHVAGVVASACEQVRLAPFDEADVAQLCESWHAVVVEDNETVRAESRKLATTIWGNARIRALAENPLMLTTLLVVRRCMGGELPTRRVDLYREAVKVLIRTWNTEGFAAMNLDETLAQLSYVACVMMNEGIQQIGHRRLLKLLQEARMEMPQELQFTRISPTEFVERVEYRSSLLMQTGHERIDDEVQPVYEFRHLTFQEYLAARGLIEEQYPGRDQAEPLVELLEPHFEEQRWREVIPLAAVLAGRKAEPLIQRLTTVCESRKSDVGNPSSKSANAAHAALLRQCLLDEVQVTPATLRAALRQMGRYGNEELMKGSVISLRRGRFGEFFQAVVESTYLDGRDGWDEVSYAMTDLAVDSVFQDQSPKLSDEMATTLGVWLTSDDRLLQIRAAFVCMNLAFQNHSVADDVHDLLAPQMRLLGDALGRLLTPDDPPLALAASWALAWMGNGRFHKMLPEPEVLRTLFQLWREADSRELQRLASWAFSAQPLLARDTFPPDTWGDCDAWLKECASTKDEQALAAMVLAWYRRRPWSDSELPEKVSEHEKSKLWPTGRELLTALGVADDGA